VPETGQQAIDQLAGALCRLGFRKRWRSPSGSRYLALPGFPFQVRISNHTWSIFSAERQCQVVCSWVVKVLPAAEIESTAAHIKARYLARIEQRRALASQNITPFTALPTQQSEPAHV